MKRERKSKITTKLLLIATAVLFGALLLFNFFSLFIFNGLESENRFYLVFIAGILSMIVWIATFILLIYHFILKRIFVLNQAVQKVAQGDYTATVPVQGTDELSTLTVNFNLMAKELQMNAMLSKNFVNYVSHEFKTPLSVIRTHAEALQVVDSETQRRLYADIIIGETDKLTELSKNIIMLCQLDCTDIIAKDDTFCPASQIKSFILSTQMQWNGKGLTIEPDFEDFEIVGNEGLTYLIWKNLIGNAYKFTNEKGNITVTLHKKHNQLLFSITDDGIGIADEDKEKIFTLFYTGDKSRNRGGSGIGLYLTKNIVEKLDGSIAFTSEYGKGSCFAVTIPI